ncbi:hypothetical protein RR46_02751 [Papilio xuthus]|uniref:Uncharacterized protein n=1 Tax=Papilio xuthus TaxID=66420 RepID=A0A194Q496_PAPXU|nr:hypothetical protein RR46_02751 [Papilio xuthus]
MSKYDQRRRGGGEAERRGGSPLRHRHHEQTLSKIKLQYLLPCDDAARTEV